MSAEGVIGAVSFIGGTIAVIVMTKLEAMGNYTSAPVSQRPQEPKR